MSASTARRLRQRVINYDSSTSLATRTRAGRWQLFAQHFPDIENLRVIDLGGTARSWLASGLRPKQLVIMNLTESGMNLQALQEELPDWVTLLVGDACLPPAGLRDEHFDLVYSNSLVEHVGGHIKRLELADTVHSLASRHWVQTPYRYFPVEPHWLFPGFQFLPVAARVWASNNWPLRSSRFDDPAKTLDHVLEVELVSKTEMQRYYPDSSILQERLGPFTKSLIAVKH